MKYFLLILAIIILSCSNDDKDKRQSSETKEIPVGEWYKTTYYDRKHDIEIIKVRDCEYVFWHYGYGSDMEHYEGCTNPIHNN